MRLMIFIFASAWLMTACATNNSDVDSDGAGHRDHRTGLCHDATPPPCEPPKD
jgi:hypothetical protein